MPFYAKNLLDSDGNPGIYTTGNGVSLDLPTINPNSYYFSSGNGGSGIIGVILEPEDLSFRYKTHYGTKHHVLGYRDYYTLMLNDIIIPQVDAIGNVTFKVDPAYENYEGGIQLIISGRFNSSGEVLRWVHCSSSTNQSNTSIDAISQIPTCTQEYGNYYWAGDNSYTGNGPTFSYVVKATSDYEPTSNYNKLKVCTSCGHPTACTLSNQSGSGGSCTCLSKKTKIELFDGTMKNIEEIEEGDIIFAYQNNKRVESKVKMVFSAFPKEETFIYSIETELGNIIEITGKHPIACQEKYKTIEAVDGYEQISNNEVLVTGDKIRKITKRRITDAVFNLKTDMDNFIANGIVVACEDTEIYEKISINNGRKSIGAKGCGFSSIGTAN